MKEILKILPEEFRRLVVDFSERNPVEELRFRIGQVLSIESQGQENFLNSRKIIAEDLENILTKASGYSVHSVQEQIAQGFLTMAGGHRLGLCGTVVFEKGEVFNLKDISSISVRVAKEALGISKGLLQSLWHEDIFQSTLILSPPGLGKTTLLRDLIRSVSEGEGLRRCRVAVVDERSELAGFSHGQPTFQMGACTDVLNACPKAQGLTFLLRSMNPQILAVDEITKAEDVDALMQVVGCGVKLLATAHGETVKDLMQRPTYRTLLEQNLFQRMVQIRWKNNSREYYVEALPC